MPITSRLPPTHQLSNNYVQHRLKELKTPKVKLATVQSAQNLKLMMGSTMFASTPNHSGNERIQYQ